MAMTFEQQKEAARRILEKEPLTEEELELLRANERNPEKYVFPVNKRVCARCGAEFEDILDSKGSIQVSMLEQFSDHQSVHNPSPAQWAEAYSRIQKSRSSTNHT